jgi:hypothetical protein
MLIYEPVRYILQIGIWFNLSCTFSEGNRLISSVLNYFVNRVPQKVLQFKLNSEIPIEVALKVFE